MDGGKRIGVGAAVDVWGEAIALLDEVYEASGGEVDEGTEAVERFAALKTDEALEALARFVRYLDASTEACDAEIERVQRAKARIGSRREWAEQRVLAILDTLGRSSKTVGPFRIRGRPGSKRVVVGEGFDLGAAPPEIKRWVDPKPGEWALDKAKAKALLESDDAMPVPGLAVERGPRTVVID